MTKFQISSLVLFLLAAVSAFATTTEIGSARDLVSLKKCAKNDTILITQDIDLKGETFSPLCRDGFKGVFNGQGHTISNLKISGGNGDNIAFIAVLSGGVLKNLNFVKPSIEVFDWLYLNNKTSVAVAVGEMQSGSVENVHVTDGKVSSTGGLGSNADAGGIVGLANSGSVSESGGSINVSSFGLIDNSNVGGICGNITGDVTLTGVSYEGNASSLVGAGGNNVTIVSKYGAVTITEKGSTKSAVIDATSKEDIPTITDVKVSAVTFNRDFATNAKSTIVLPFSISVSKVRGGTFYEIARMIKTDGKWAVGIRVLGNNATLNANTPYIVVANATNLTFSVSKESPVTLNTSSMNNISIDVYESADAAATPIEEDAWTFKGTYDYKVFGQMGSEFGKAYGFSGEAKDGISIGAFVRGGAGATIRPLRAYLVYEGGQSSSKTASLNYNSAFTELPDEVDVVVLDEQNNVTECGVMNTVTGQIRMDRWYDLQGRRLNSEPTVQGTYYHNGKRVIVK